MPAGRPTEGLEHIEHLHGSFEAKLRLKTIVLSVLGDVSVVEACERLGIQSSRFHVVRRDALQAAVDRLEPHHAGRPRGESEATSARVRTLEERLGQREIDVRHERTRAEIALATSSAAPVRDRGGQSRSG
jgi:hypothetical protein